MVSILSGSLLLIVLIFLFVNYRIIKPISLVTTAILRFAKKDLNVQVPIQHYQIPESFESMMKKKKAKD